MYCKQCGNQIPDNAILCVKCGVPTGQGSLTHASMVAGTPSCKTAGINRTAYVLLALFAGCFGVHNFYAGYTGRGVAQLAIFIFGLFLFGIPWIPLIVWVIVEMCTVKKDSKGNDFC